MRAAAAPLRRVPKAFSCDAYNPSLQGRAARTEASELNATDSGTGLIEQRPPGGPPRDPQAEYADVCHRIHGLVGSLLDRGSTVAVVSKGDPELIRLESAHGWHFPRTTDGKYAGHHPADGAEVITHLEQLREQGADYFVLPSTYFWWLDHYDGLAQHLGSRYRLVADCPDACLIYDLRRGPVATGTPVTTPRAGSGSSTNGERVQNPLVPVIRALLDSLLPDRERVLVFSGGNDELLQLGRIAVHFPHDRQGKFQSIDSLGQGAITAQLIAARERRIRYLVLPDDGGQAAEHVWSVREALRGYGREVAIRKGICAIYELDKVKPARPEQRSSRGLRGVFRLRGRRSDG